MKKNNSTEDGLTAEKLIEIGKETRRFVLATLTPEERLSGLDAKDRRKVEKEMRNLVVASLTPEERLAGLAPEEVAKLMEQIERYLSQHEAEK